MATTKTKYRRTSKGVHVGQKGLQARIAAVVDKANIRTDFVGDLGDGTQASGGDARVVERGEMDLHPGDIDRAAQLVVQRSRFEESRPARDVDRIVAAGPFAGRGRAWSV